MPLLDEKASDVTTAKKIKYSKSHHNSVKKERRNFLNIRSSSIFGERSTKQKALLQAAERKNGVASIQTPSSSSHSSGPGKEKKSKKKKPKSTVSSSAPLLLLFFLPLMFLQISSLVSLPTQLSFLPLTSPSPFPPTASGTFPCISLCVVV